MGDGQFYVLRGMRRLEGILTMAALFARINIFIGYGNIISIKIKS